jgi:hypothetical protein
MSLVPNNDVKNYSNDNSDKNIISDIEKSSEILPVNTEKITGIQKTSVRNKIAEKIIKKKCE